MADNSYTADGGAYAKYGGLTPANWAQGLANVILPAYQATFPNARAANLFNGVNQAYNVYKYNKQSQRDKAQTEQAVGKKYADMGLDMQTGVDKQGNPTYSLDPSIYKQVAPDYGNAQGIEALRRGAEGKDPQPGYLVPMDKMQSWYQDNVMKPNLENNQNINTLNQINQQNPYDTGASQNPTQALQKFVQQPPAAQGLGAMQPPGPTPLLAGAVAQGPAPEPPPPPMSPMDRFLGQNYAGNPATIVSGASQKATETNQKGTLAETISHNAKTAAETAKHNRATEGQAARELTDKEKADYFHKYPPVGPAFNLGAAEWASATPAQRQAIINKAGGNTPPKAPTVVIPNDKQKAVMQDLARQGMPSNGGLFGWGAHGANPALIEQYNRYAPKYGYQKLDPNTSAPFGNRSKSNLDANTAAISKSIYPGKGK